MKNMLKISLLCLHFPASISSLRNTKSSILLAIPNKTFLPLAIEVRNAVKRGKSTVAKTPRGVSEFLHFEKEVFITVSKITS